MSCNLKFVKGENNPCTATRRPADLKDMALHMRTGLHLHARWQWHILLENAFDLRSRLVLLCVDRGVQKHRQHGASGDFLGGQQRSPAEQNGSKPYHTRNYRLRTICHTLLPASNTECSIARTILQWVMSCDRLTSSSRRSKAVIVGGICVSKLT